MFNVTEQTVSQYRIICDICSCSSSGCNLASEAREMVWKSGWKYENEKNICPECQRIVWKIDTLIKELEKIDNKDLEILVDLSGIQYQIDRIDKNLIILKGNRL